MFQEGCNRDTKFFIITNRYKKKITQEFSSNSNCDGKQVIELSGSITYINQFVMFISGLQITDSRLPVMMTGQTPILAGQIMNTNNFFWPKEYPIMLAIDRYYYIDVHIFDSKLVKMHSHVVEFLSAVFARFNVTFYLEYHCTAVSEVSRGKK